VYTKIDTLVTYCIPLTLLYYLIVHVDRSKLIVRTLNLRCSSCNGTELQANRAGRSVPVVVGFDLGLGCQRLDGPEES
jgi:hypothetical protein